jgi:RecB family exonuclease
MYKYDYFDKIGKFYHKSRAGNSFGATLHQALQQFHEAGGTDVEGVEALTERAMNTWRSAGFADVEEEVAHKELASQILQKYHVQAQQRAGQTRVFLSEKMLKFDMGSFILMGRVDRVDEYIADGALEIVDYKSGRLEVTEDQVRSALAMSIYQLLAKRKYPERRVFATIHALRSGVYASAELSDQELAELEIQIKGIAQDIIEMEWDAIRPVYLVDVCPDCDFLSRCTKYWNAIERRRSEEL